MLTTLLNFLKKYLAHLAFIQALVATLTSLYYSEMVRLPPCSLCWYQRIFMYPLVSILFIGIYRRDKNLPYYVLPLSISGAVVALYHYLIQKGVWWIHIIPCSINSPCALTQSVNYFGFITIPFLSFLAFSVISILMLIKIKK